MLFLVPITIQSGSGIRSNGIKSEMEKDLKRNKIQFTLENRQLCDFSLSFSGGGGGGNQDSGLTSNSF